MKIFKTILNHVVNKVPTDGLSPRYKEIHKNMTCNLDFDSVEVQDPFFVSRQKTGPDGAVSKMVDCLCARSTSSIVRKVWWLKSTQSQAKYWFQCLLVRHNWAQNFYVSTQKRNIIKLSFLNDLILLSMLHAALSQQVAILRPRGINSPVSHYPPRPQSPHGDPSIWIQTTLRTHSGTVLCSPSTDLKHFNVKIMGLKKNFHFIITISVNQTGCSFLCRLNRWPVKIGWLTHSRTMKL